MSVVKNIYTDLDLHGNELKRWRVEATDVSPNHVRGGIYYDLVRNEFMFGMADDWKPVSELFSSAWREEDGRLVTELPVHIKNDLFLDGDVASTGEGQDMSFGIQAISVNGDSPVYPNDEGILELTIETGGGDLDIATLATYLNDNKYINADNLDTYGVATKSWVNGLDYATKSELSGGLNTKQNVINEKNLLPYSYLSGVPVLAAVATSGKYSDLTGVPTSLPASDVYDWAKKSSLAVADVPDLSSKYISVNGGTITSGHFIMGAAAGDLVAKSIYPRADITSYNGLSTRRWTYVHAVNGDFTETVKVNSANSEGILSGDYITINATTAGGWDRAFRMAHNGTVKVKIGSKGTGTALDYAYIGTSYSSPWIAFKPTATEVNGNLIVAGDVSSGSAGQENVAYLPLTGGTLTGNLSINSKLFATSPTFYLYGSDGTNAINLIDYSADSSSLWLGYGSAVKSHVTQIAGYRVDLCYGTSRTRGLVLNESGKVLIGTTSTIHGAGLNGKLHVNGAVNISYSIDTTSWISDYGHIRLRAGSTKYYLGLSATTDGYGVIQSALTGTGAVPLLLNPKGGSVAIGASTIPDTVTKLYVVGNITATGLIAQGSDIRYKDVIESREISLEDIAYAPLFTFRWNNGTDNDIHLGTSAQYWENRTPWLVKGKDFKGLDYSTLAVAGIISIARKTMNHEARINELEAEVERLKEEMNNGAVCE